jgi:hypothetical protein
MVISSQGAPLYVATNIETLGQSAWIASASVADSYNGGAWAAFDFGEGKSFAAAEVFIHWVFQFNTPKEIAIKGPMMAQIRPAWPCTRLCPLLVTRHVGCRQRHLNPVALPSGSGELRPSKGCAIA